MIIYLHGPSGSGKTAIARELQEILDGLFLRFSLDSIWSGFPESVLRRKREGDDLSDIQCPGVGRAYHDCVQALASIGFHLIIDDDLPDDVVSRHMNDILEKHETVLVGIRCPLPELQRREAERSDRAAGSARRGFETIHTTLKYDLTVDTSELMAKEAATQIARFVRERCSGNEGGSP